MHIFDFLQDDEFNQLREQMNAPLLETTNAFVNVAGLTQQEWVALRNGGLEIDSKLIKQGKDGTLSYKDVRVTLNIRDINANTSRELSLPKIHIGYCKTLDEMQRNARFERYIVSMEKHMNRQINVVKDNQTVNSDEHELDVCRNCLGLLSWKRYHGGMTLAAKNQIVAEFSLVEFFEKYPQTLKLEEYEQLHTEQSQPSNVYHKNWAEISLKVRERMNWQCEECDGDFRHNKRQLHVHHVNGLKYDNSSKNLRALCHDCHAKQPYHGHMLAKS
ncbi:MULTISPECIES: HNH endonuclease [Vitreoscilla]|uniref:HNH endonuclease n=1 Tax=Vitreoscilla stercoraria TaxID=61 RepID=A0ABY4ED16_VITST|nr:MULTISPECIES: HNH endonuclease signature motif containing protein [Vitreoscilla]AUZ06098.1 hypothetical protein ADP71_28610 [Vitreoscilla sp. C1]UOO92538.1 HNH endonuclease [Vitreoscilla stercoraria]